MIEKLRTPGPAGTPTGNKDIMKNVEAAPPKPDVVPRRPHLPRQGSFTWSS